jgi:hypothetical protein
LFNRMNCKFKQVAVRASRASKSLFQERSSSSSRREAMLRCACANEEEVEKHVEEEEEQQRVKEEEQLHGEEEEADLEHVPRQTRRSHVVSPPPMPSREEDRVLIRPVGDH